MAKKSQADNVAAEARRDEQRRQAVIRSGTARINRLFDSEFGDDFFQGRRDAFMGFAKPELDRQYRNAEKQLTFDLARSGLLDSSVRGEKAAALSRLYDTNLQGLTSEALDYENQTRDAVEGARSNLINMLNATGDDSAAIDMAMSRAKLLSQPPAYRPLSQLFQDFTGIAATQADFERQHAYGGPAPRYNVGLFRPPKDAVRVR